MYGSLPALDPKPAALGVIGQTGHDVATVKRTRSIIVAIACPVLAAVIIAADRLSDGQKSTLEVVFYLVALTALTAIPALALRNSRMGLVATILASPVLYFSADQFLVGYGWANLPQFVSGQWYPLLRPTTLPLAAALALAANIMLWAGYLARPSRALAKTLGRRLMPALTNTHVRPNIIAIWFAFCLGICVRVYTIQAGFAGYFSLASARADSENYVQYLNLLSMLGPLGMVSYECVLLRKSGAHWPLFFAMAIVDLVMAILSGFKGQILFQFVYLAVPYALIRRRIPKSLIVVTVATMILTFPVVNTVRLSFVHDGMTAGDISDLSSAFFSSTSATLSGGSTSNFVTNSVSQMARSAAQLEPLAMVVQYANDTGLRWHGVEFLSPFYSFIPRALWPDKPILNHGGWVTTVVYRLRYTSATSQTVPGDLYLNFGWEGVIAGMFVIGLMTRLMTEIGWSTMSLRFLPLIPFLIYDFGFIQADLGAVIADDIRDTLFLIVVLHILFPSQRARPPAAHIPVLAEAMHGLPRRHR